MEPFEEVFPSQEYVKYPAPNDPSQICAKFPVMRQGREIEQASVHSQKIGAALRTIDDWHGDARGAVPVNPYAGVQSEGVALRNRIHDKAPSFKDLQQKGLGTQLKKDIEAASEAEEMPGEAHFFVGVLLRGGVFGTNDTANESA